MTKQVELMCDSHHGIFIPQIMIERLVEAGWNGFSCGEIADLKEGPDDNEWYWQAWENVLNNAYLHDENGIEWRLHHDGDLFACHADYDFHEY